MNPASSAPVLSRKITRLYLVALAGVALLTGAGQWFMQRSLASQLHDSKVINVAGRQRMLSQKISKTVLLLQHPAHAEQTATHLQDLHQALKTWQTSHLGLKNGQLDVLGTSFQNSLALQRKFREIEPYYQALYGAAHAIGQLSALPHANQMDSAKLHGQVRQVLANEPAYLRIMDEMVSLYDAEATQRVNRSRQMELLLLCLTLGILLLEGLFIFRPMVRQIAFAITRLTASERQTQAMNTKLRHANQTLAETREALVAATEEQYKREIRNQKLRLAYLMEGQEEERKRVAQEIHDGLGQMLTALKFGLERCKDSLPEPANAERQLLALQDLLGKTIAEARAISFDLMPAVLHDFGLSSALKLLAAQATTGTGVQVSFRSNWTGQRLPKNVEVGLYRIGQEALQNALKYARAQHVTLALSVKKKYIHLRITDDGQGFSPPDPNQEQTAISPSQGLRNMKERASLLEGHLEFKSVPGAGTQIHVKLPHSPYSYA